MARLASIGTGNWLTAGTWGVINSTLYSNSETSTVVCPTSYSNVARSAQQTPGAITVSHIGVKLSVRTGTTGTITVHIANSSHVEVTGTAVTINTADLPSAATADLNGGWHFFKLASPVTLIAATLYEVEAQTSSSSQISLFASAATNGLSCALITTTTQAPTTGDDVFISGEYTGTGTSNLFAVIMDVTTTTDHGAASTSLVTPAIAISNKGILTYSTTAATNYILKVSGNLIIYSGGILRMGQSGAECPRDSTMKLNFDCGSNVDFGLTVRNLGTFITHGLSRTSGKNIYYCKLNTDEATNSTSLGVDTDTGWLDNDEIAVASTTRTASQSEKGTLNGNAGASSLTVDGFAGAGGGLANDHSGTSPTQAEVILLTRNVSIYGTSTTVCSYINIAATATVDCDWTAFYFLGSATANKRGIDIATTTGSCSIQYCSRYSSTVSNTYGFQVNSSSGSNINLSYNVTYNIHAYHLYVSNASNGTHTYTYNIFILNSSGPIVHLSEAGGVFTYNTIVSAATTGMVIGDYLFTLGTFSDITIHSCAGVGLRFSASCTGGTISNCVIWRNSSYGLDFGTDVNAFVSNVTFYNCRFFGCVGASVNSSASPGIGLVFDTCYFNGDTTFSTSYGIYTSILGALIEGVAYNCEFGVASGIYTTHSADITSGTGGIIKLRAINCKFASSTEVGSQSSMLTNTIITSQRHDQTSGLHKTFKSTGTITIETTTVHSPGVTSMKLTPLSSTVKLTSEGFYGGFKVPVENGQLCTPSVYVYEDASYNGSRARLILKRNDAMGISADTVIDTATASSDEAWEQLTGNTVTVIDDGTLEFYIDVDGTFGNVFIGSFSATVT